MSVILGSRQAQPLLHRQQEHSERFLRAPSEQVHDEGKEHEGDEKTPTRLVRLACHVPGLAAG